MDAHRRQQVRERAADRCEYCRLSQRHDPFHPFHAEHIVARQHGGKDELQNLAWACHQCNLHKGPNLAGIDPDTNQMVRLFHPRLDHWPEHFAWQGLLIIGLTAVGRTSVWVLDMNAEERVELRRVLLALGELEP
jgi:hypothetical protein